LQERLHILLTRLSNTTELIKKWPESDGDDASVHVETTTKLIICIEDVIKALQKVEGVIKADAVLKKSLQECKVPINLLDLFDHGKSDNGKSEHGYGLNPGKRRKRVSRQSKQRLFVFPAKHIAHICVDGRPVLRLLRPFCFVARLFLERTSA